MVQCGAATGCSAGHMQLQLQCPGQLGRCKAGRPVQQRCCTGCTRAAAAAPLRHLAALQLSCTPHVSASCTSTKTSVLLCPNRCHRARAELLPTPQTSSGMQQHHQRTYAPAKLQLWPLWREKCSCWSNCCKYCCYASGGSAVELRLMCN